MMKFKISIYIVFILFALNNCFAQSEENDIKSFQSYYDSLVENETTLEYYLKEPSKKKFVKILKSHTELKCIGKVSYAGFELKESESYFLIHAVQVHWKSRMRKLLVKLNDKGNYLDDPGKTRIDFYHDGDMIYFYVSARISVDDTRQFFDDFITNELGK